MTPNAVIIPEFSRRISGNNRFAGSVEKRRFIIIWGNPGSERKRTITLLKKRSTMLKTWLKKRLTMLKTWPTPKFYLIKRNFKTGYPKDKGGPTILKTNTVSMKDRCKFEFQ